MKRIATTLGVLIVALTAATAAAPGQKAVVHAPSTTAATTAQSPEEAPSATVVQAAALNGMAGYAIDWSSINGGGAIDAASPNYRLGSSVGQSVAGAASSANHRMGIGFWYGANAGGCACDCHGDPVCDAVISNVQDVVVTVNVAFRGAAPVVDPNGACPYETTDLNCDGATSVIDVVKIVNVAFRGANPATEYCNPCA
ncbi:MAG TPA: hypothetical protein VNN55_01090 [bacterium]|nr:hypothetical protein [bacterium]